MPVVVSVVAEAEVLVVAVASVALASAARLILQGGLTHRVQAELAELGPAAAELDSEPGVTHRICRVHRHLFALQSRADR